MRLLSAVLRRLVRQGTLIVVSPDGVRHSFGDGTGHPVTMWLRDRRVALDLVCNPQLKLGEAYMDGRIDVDGGSVSPLLDLMGRNIGMGHGGGHNEWIAGFRFLARRLMQWNGEGRSRHNVAHHYDLPGAFYDLFLDADRQYSCAFFETQADTLEVAQANKKRRLAAKLALRPGLRVLDIGSGWGGLSLHLAETQGADVTGITLSTEQLKVARARAEAAGLGARVQFRLEDYRQVQGTYDRIVSVGMFEHVGVVNYDTYFRRIASLLNDDGVAVVHSIGRSDGAGVTNPWIQKYIFPGGYTPALSEVLPAIERAGLMVTDIEILRLHYALTLAAWRQRFTENRERVRRMHDERFCRMWEFYLAGSEAGFRHQGLMVFQIQLARRVDALPIVRDYMMAPQPAGQALAGVRRVA